MTTEQQSSFLEKLEEKFSANTEDRLQKSRLMGWNQLQQMGLPSRAREDYRYVKLRKMWALDWKSEEKASTSIEKHIEAERLDECRESCLVFLNGSLSLELSRLEALPDLVVLSLSEGMKKYKSLILKI